MPISDLILTLISLLLQVWLMAILIQKGLYRRLPFFAAYTVYSILAGCVRMALLGGNYITYFYVYWATEPLYALLGLLAMVESYKEVFRAFYVARWFRLFLPLVALITIGLSVAAAIMSPPVQVFRLGAMILSAEIMVRFLQGGIFVLFIALSRLFRIQPPRYPEGVLDGFGMAATGILVAALFRADFGTRFNTFFSLVPAVTYILATLIWLTSFRREEDGLQAHPYGHRLPHHQ